MGEKKKENFNKEMESLGLETRDVKKNLVEIWNLKNTKTKTKSRRLGSIAEQSNQRRESAKWRSEQRKALTSKP